ncbi:outer membrane beta-barrel protein [Wenyingzhuangia sp. chi5]|uniref:Outer membrane beta-barrel protein n=1 Tax=Wenyingzhuangia gilva TaxID=3057677 RepID=A0ABT8VSA0_9FLAO|nr:outer membrane beta-barrel protein [Wenyingzhuangia sp. chi5]MDO3694846.1 outer membrane beta-barrel protein [Wenyingzhuangia sp. chi5]
MKKKLIIALSMIMLFCVKSFAQNSFKDGYIITTENDTIYGQIKDRLDTNNYISCLFKKNQQIKEYYPSEIKEFGYNNYKVFKSRIVIDEFAELLVQGNTNLYKSRDMYHLQKEGDVFDLKSEVMLVEVNRLIGHTEVRNNRWKGIVAYFINDCLTNASNIIVDLKYDEKELTDLIIKYNKCKGGGYREIKSSKKWNIIKYGIIVGLKNSYIKARDESSRYSYINDNSIHPTFGLLVSIKSPRISEKISYQGELHFSKSSYSSSSSEFKYTTLKNYDSYIDLTTLSIPISFKYAFSKKETNLYFQGGVNVDYHLKSKLINYEESINNNIVYTTNNNDDFEINKTQIGILAGLGFHKSFNNFNAEISLRYTHQLNNLDAQKVFRGQKNSFSINLILLKK